MDNTVDRWNYIGEGNAHIVLDVLDTDNVIRIIKDEDLITDKRKIQDSAKFVNLVMTPLLCRSNADSQEVLELSDQAIAKLTAQLTPLRPSNRLSKTKLSPFVIKAKNLTLLSRKCRENYCVEIKPKEGFLASNLAVKAKCYYCLKQFLKLQEKQIHETSDYCPLDLFSGDRQRMKRALGSLVKNPQNNFKMFNNSKLIYSENSEVDFDTLASNIPGIDSADVLFNLIIEILLSDAESNIETIHNTDNNDVMTKHNKKCNEDNILTDKMFLHKILHLQKLTETSSFDCELENNDLEYVSTSLKLIETNKLNLANCKDVDTFLSTLKPEYVALISSVVKDCSIMISFAPSEVKEYPIIKINDHKFSFNIAVTDLEPKSVRTLLKRRENEKKLIEIYDKYLHSTLIQPHSETRAKQLEAWQQLITEYLKVNKQSTIDVREAQNSPLFNNPSIERTLSQESVLVVLEDMAKSGRAVPVDKSKQVWEVYWHSLDEWGSIVYNWASSNGLTNSVCTLFELREGENTIGEEFHGLDMNVLLKALKALEGKGKCELMEFDDNQGVKFF